MTAYRKLTPSCPFLRCYQSLWSCTWGWVWL